MGGVDLSDQRIAYYHPNVRCRRNWIPMFLQLMSIMRNNSYIVYSHHYKKNAISHKAFTLEMIDTLMQNAEFHKNEYSPTSTSPNTRQARRQFTLSSASPKQKRQPIIASEDDILANFDCRKNGSREDHQPVSGKRGACVWCCILYNRLKEKGENVDWDKFVKRTRKCCGHCTRFSKQGEENPCYLCKEHFTTFHEA